MNQETPIPNYKSFKRFIISTVVALILLLLGFSAWKSVIEYQLTINGAEMQARGYTRALKEHAERTFSEADDVLLNITDYLQDGRGFNGTNSQPLIDLLLRNSRNIPQGAEIIVVNSEGLLFANSTLHTIEKKTSVADREYFIHHRDNPYDDTPFLSSPVKSRLDGNWRIVMSRPVRSAGGHFLGLAGIGFNVDYFRNFYASLDLGKNGRILMVRKDGALMLAEPFNEKDFTADFRKSNLIRTYLPRSTSGTYHINGKSLLEGDSRIISYESLSAYPVVALTNMSKDELTSPWHRGTMLQLLLTLAACFGIAALTLVLLRQIRRIQIAYQRQSEHQAEITAAATAWHSTFDSVADAILVLDLDRRIVRCNSAAVTLFGKGTDQVLGRLCCEVVHNGHTPLCSCPFKKMMESGERAGAQISIAGHWFEVSVDPVRNTLGAITGAVHIVSDITQLKLAEEKAIESEAHMRGLLSAIPDPIYFKDASGKFMLVNDAGIELFCLQGVDYLGKTELELAEIIPARRDVLLACRKSDLTAWERRCQIHGEETIPASDGRAHVFDTIKIPLYKPDGSRHGIIILGRDITDQRQMEMQLRQSQKMEAIGHLAGGIAHDFNNLLTPIMGYAEMAAASIPGGDPLGPKLTGIIKAAHKAKALTEQLLSFGRRQSIVTEVIDLNEVILSFNSILRRTIRESIRIDLVLAPEGSFIKGDRSQIEQIILNMTVNAQDAFDGTQGRINIETCKILMDGENARMHPGMAPGEYLLLSFRDNGCGMSAEVIGHIFEPFFTTKQVGRGTGLGLATVYGIVKQHDAHLSVTSREGEGTTFNIYFPVCSQVPLMLPQAVPLPRRKAVGEVTILVVEDNEMVRDMVREMLTGHGYTVLAAADPQHAIELLSNCTAQIDLLVSDVVMPGMNGPELYEQLVVQIPSLKVVFISGYPINPSLRSGTLEESVNYLQKPFTTEALLERIALVL